MARVEYISTAATRFEELSFASVGSAELLRIHGELPEDLRIAVSAAVRLAHSLERGERGERYLDQGCILISDRLAGILEHEPFRFPAFVFSTSNTAVRHSNGYPRGWRRATEYLNHAVAAVLDPGRSIFTAIDCTAPHYLEQSRAPAALADVIVASSERALAGKLSSYYGGICWERSVSGSVPLPDIL